MFKPVLTTAALVLSAVPVLAAPAQAAQTRETARLPYPVERVWQRIAPFCGLAEWHPAVETCTLNLQGGTPVRTIALKGGGEIEERLIQSSDAKHELKYTILSSPLPVKDYVATLSVRPDGSGGSRLVWKASFTPNGVSTTEARKTVSGIFTSGFAGLKQALAAQ